MIFFNESLAIKLLFVQVLTCTVLITLLLVLRKSNGKFALFIAIAVFTVTQFPLERTLPTIRSIQRGHDIIAEFRMQAVFTEEFLAWSVNLLSETAETIVTLFNALLFSCRCDTLPISWVVCTSVKSWKTLISEMKSSGCYADAGPFQSWSSWERQSAWLLFPRRGSTRWSPLQTNLHKHVIFRHPINTLYNLRMQFKRHK